MCVLIFDEPKIDLSEAKKRKDLIGKNLIDFEVFKPLIDMALLDRLKELKDYCNCSNINYDVKLRKMCEIVEIEYGFHTIIVPFFCSRSVIFEKDPLFIKWCELLKEYF